VLPPVAAVCAGLLLFGGCNGVAGTTPTPPLDCRVTPASLTDAIRCRSTAPQRDRSHGGRYDLRAWNDTSIGDSTNLMRDGFFPHPRSAFRTLTADVMILIAPQRLHAAGRVLRHFMDRGGRLLVMSATRS
jgi:hypothetical protein